MPMVRKTIHSHCVPDLEKSGNSLVEAMSNVMHAVFLILQNTQESTCYQIFSTLFSNHFDEVSIHFVIIINVNASLLLQKIHENEFRLKNRPSFSKMVELLEECQIPVRIIVEGLLAHFFSPDRPSYADEDVLYFLEMANQQEQWCDYPLSKDSAETSETVRYAKKVITMYRCAHVYHIYVGPDYQDECL